MAHTRCSSRLPFAFARSHVPEIELANQGGAVPTAHRIGTADPGRAADAEIRGMPGTMPFGAFCKAFTGMLV